MMVNEQRLLQTFLTGASCFGYGKPVSEYITDGKAGIRGARPCRQRHRADGRRQMRHPTANGYGGAMRYREPVVNDGLIDDKPASEMTSQALLLSWKPLLADGIRLRAPSAGTGFTVQKRWLWRQSPDTSRLPHRDGPS